MQLIPIHEYNQCHEPSGPKGGQFCSTGYLQGEAGRARKLGVRFEAHPTVNVRNSGYYFKKKRVVVGVRKDSWNLNRAGVLSVARHELGHATDPDYGKKVAQATIDGQRFGATYAAEFGAWKAAIRDSRGRVQWSTVRKALTGYLSDDPAFYQVALARHPRPPTMEDPGYSEAAETTWEAAVAAFYERTLDRHVDILRRYARRVRQAS